MALWVKDSVLLLLWCRVWFLAQEFLQATSTERKKKTFKVGGGGYTNTTLTSPRRLDFVVDETSNSQTIFFKEKGIRNLKDGGPFMAQWK